MYDTNGKHAPDNSTSRSWFVLLILCEVDPAPLGIVVVLSTRQHDPTISNVLGIGDQINRAYLFAVSKTTSP